MNLNLADALKALADADAAGNKRYCLMIFTINNDVSVQTEVFCDIHRRTLAVHLRQLADRLDMGEVITISEESPS